jgi:hypothetical protein
LAGVRTLKDLLFRILNSEKQRMGPILPKQVSVPTFYTPSPVPPTL